MFFVFDNFYCLNEIQCRYTSWISFFVEKTVLEKHDEDIQSIQVRYSLANVIFSSVTYVTKLVPQVKLLIILRDRIQTKITFFLKLLCACVTNEAVIRAETP